VKKNPHVSTASLLRTKIRVSRACTRYWCGACADLRRVFPSVTRAQPAGTGLLVLAVRVKLVKLVVL